MDAKDELTGVVVLTDNYRIIGKLRVAPDGSIWDLKHRAAEGFVTIFNAQFYLLSDGRRAYDARSVEVNRNSIVALFREEDLVNMRKLGQ